MSALRKEHTCDQGTYRDGGCGDPAYDLRGGEWMCERHVDRFDFDVYATSILSEQPADWDSERAEADAEGERRYQHWRKCVLEDDPEADASMEAYADDLLATYEANVESAMELGVWGVIR
jgi:hypothetical protein